MAAAFADQATSESSEEDPDAEEAEIGADDSDADEAESLLKQPAKQELIAWHGEAWHRDDGLVLNLPVFKPCSAQFKRSVLREIRMYECGVYGCETWWDRANDLICTLETLAWDKMPPLLDEARIGESYDKGDYICRGGDFDAKLLVVLAGSVEKLIGDSVNGGRCIVRTLHRGDCEGMVEFLGAGSDQRCCALRAAEDGTRVRLVEREGIDRICALKRADTVDVQPLKPHREDDDGLSEKNESTPREVIKDTSLLFQMEADYFEDLMLDRIDSIPHKSGKDILIWKPCGDGEAMASLVRAHRTTDERVEIEHENIDKFSLGSRITIEGPEGTDPVEVRTVVGIDRNRLELDKPLEASHVEGATVKKEPLDFLKLPEQTFFFVDDSMGLTQAGPLAEGLEDRYFLDGAVVLKRGVPGDCAIMILRGQVEAEVPEGCEGNCLHIADVLQTANIDVTMEGSWLGDGRPEPPAPPPAPPPQTVAVQRLPSKANQRGWTPKPKTPPPPLPPPEVVPPRAVLGPGTIIGQLSLLSVPLVFAGTLRAKGPCVVVVLHRHALLEALEGQEELAFFQRVGIDPNERRKFLLSQCPGRKLDSRPDHMGPATGPPMPRNVFKETMAKASTVSAWRSPEGHFSNRSGADALQWVLLNAIHESILLSQLLDDAPPRLVEAFMNCWEPCFLLPNEVVVVDEEPNADFMFVVIYGTFVVMLEGCQIDEISQGAVLGEGQLLGLNDWTRTVTVHPKNDGEAMIQVLRRDKLLQVLAGHPMPRTRLRQLEQELHDAKGADWRILSRVPTFISIASKPFLSRLHKDADILYYAPGDHIVKAGDPGASLLVVLAGTCRSEQPQTLFCLELKRGDWCFQNNILGNDADRQHDVIAVTHTMVLFLHRHALLNAVTAYPATRKVVFDNEKWRVDMPRIADLRCYERVPKHVLRELEDAATPQYCIEGSVILGPDNTIPPDSLLLITRGEAVVSIMDIPVRTLKAGDILGLLSYLKLPVLPPNCRVVAQTPCDMMRFPVEPMDRAEEDELIEESMKTWVTTKTTLSGGPIYDEYGFETAYGGFLATDCIEKSEVLSVCGPAFVNQMCRLVEDQAFFPGEELCRQGEPGDRMFFIQAGRVRVRSIGMPDEMVEAGGTVGEMACIGLINEQQSTALAETNVWARVLHKPLLARALIAFPGEEKRLKGARSPKAPGLFAD